MSEWNGHAVGFNRLIKALGYSLCGIKYAYQGEAAFRQELLLACLLIPTALFLPVTPTDRAIMVGSVILVLIIELLNAAIEAVVDKVSPEWHALAKKAKDMASAAVLVALVGVLATWGIILRH